MKSASMPEFGTSGVSNNPYVPRQGGRTWSVLDRSSHLLSEFRCVFTQPTFPDLRVPHDGMGSFPSSPFRHRVDLVQRLHPQAAPQPLPSLLQQGALVCWTRFAGVLARLVVATFAAHRDDRTGGRRHALPQTRLDGLRHRHAPRSVDLQPRQAADQLGARLGRPDADRPLSLLGSHQGLEPATRFSLVSQSPGRSPRERRSRRNRSRRSRTPTTAPGPNWRWS